MYRWAVVVMMSVFVSENVLAENWGTKDYIQQYEKEMKALDASMKNSFSSFSQDIMVIEGDRNKNSKSKEKVKNTIPYYDSQAKEQDFSEKNLRKKGHKSQVKEGMAKDDDIKAEQDASIRGEKSAIKFRQESYLRKHRYKEGDLKDVTNQNIPNKGDIGIDIADVIENPLIGLNKGDEQGGLDTACSVSDSENTTVKPKLEPYEVEIDDVREKEVKHECQEDDDRLYYCTRTLNPGVCISKSDCGEDRGGIILDSVESSGVWQYSYPNIRFGNKEGHWEYKSVDACGDNYSCRKVVIPARFRIKRVSEIKTFRLKKVAFDDHAMVKVNGQVLYNSLGGNRLDIYRQCGAWDQEVQAGWGIADICMQNHGNNHYKRMDVDLKPYLREGVNEIEMTLIYSMLGQFNIEIEASQYCCNKWGSDKWESDCPVY